MGWGLCTVLGVAGNGEKLTRTGDYADVGTTNISQSPDFAGPVHSQFEYGQRVRLFEPEKGEGQADFIVEIPHGRQRLVFAADDVGEHGSGRGFAIGASQGNYRQRGATTVEGCQIAQCPGGVCNSDDDGSPCCGVFKHQALCLSLFNQNSPHTLFYNTVGKCVTVVDFADDGDKQLT